MINSPMKKKIHLAVCANFPYFGGDPFAIQQLTKGLSQKGFRITLIGPCQKATARIVRSFPWIHQFCLFNYGGWKSSILKKLSKNPPDAVLNSGYMGYPVTIALRFQKPLFWRVMSRARGPMIRSSFISHCKELSIKGS